MEVKIKTVGGSFEILLNVAEEYRNSLLESFISETTFRKNEKCIVKQSSLSENFP